MTDTLIQNSNINEVIDITKYQLSSKPETNGGFSALLTNASNKAEQTQSNFIDTAVKSNTSSINKYALEGRNDKNNRAQSKKRNADNNSEINRAQTLTQNVKAKNKNIQNNQTTKMKNNQTALNSGRKTVEPKETVSKTASLPQTPVSKNQKVSANADSNPQNINNSSLEPSPISLDNTTSDNTQDIKLQAEISNTEIVDTKDIQSEIKELAENILITFDIPTNTNEDNSINTQGLLGNSEAEGDNYDYVIQSIDEISSQIENMDLSKDDKDKIIEALDKLKVAAQNIKENFEINQENNEIINDAEKLLDKLVSKNISDDKQTDTKDFAKINMENGNIQKTYSKENEAIKEDIKDLKETIDKIVSDKDLLNDAEVEQLSAKLDEIISKMEQAGQNTQNVQDIEFFKDLKENIKNNNIDEIGKKLNKLSDLIESHEYGQTKDAENIGYSDKTTPQIQKGKINLENEENEKISEIITKLEEFEKTQQYNDLSAEDKKEIQEIINKLSETKPKQTSNDNEKIVEKAKEEIDKIINTDTKKADSDIKVSQNEQINVNQNQSVKLSDSNFNQNNTNERNDNSQKEPLHKAKLKVDTNTADYKKTQNNVETNETDIDIDIDINTDNNETIQKTDNGNKFSLINEIKEDFIESIEYTKESPVVISVADEVVKFALSENNSLPNQMAVGNITYDPANSALQIKNAQNLILQNGRAETNLDENNILNQIGDKLYQLKDSQKLNLILRPNDLGRLSIELTSDKNGLTTNIVAQNEAVRNYIERNISTLRNQLAEAGVNVNSIQIKTAGQENATTYEGNQNKEFTQEENAQKQNQQQFQQKQNQRQQENLAHLRNYDMHFVKDFSSVMDKTLSYIN